MELFEKCYLWEKYRVPFALVTIIDKKGTGSRKEGRMAVSKSGETIGTIGGGKQEMDAKEEAMDAIKTGSPKRVVIPVRDKGEIKVMIDIPQKDRSVVIVGAGHVGRALYSLFYSLSWHVTVVDTRLSILTKESFPYGERIVSSTILEGLEKSTLDSNTAFISTIPEENMAILPYVTKSDVFYIGLLTSRKRYWSGDERLHAPMGYDIGEETPEEIALSTVSEVYKEFSKKSGKPNRDWRRRLVVVRGAGDLATGVIVTLHNAGYDCIALEVEKPTVIRRTVSFADAIYEGRMKVEGVECQLSNNLDDALSLLKEGIVPLLIDPDGKTIEELKPGIVVDAIIAKKNLGSNKDMAPFVVALGPGFEAGKDVSVVIETMRGHNLGRIIKNGSALPNTGVPGLVGGKSKERVIHSPAQGIFKGVKAIGDIVEEGDTIAYIDNIPVKATINGRLRGLLHDGLYVPEHFKIADIDPRGEESEYKTISDKARAIGGSVLEAIDSFLAV